MAVTNWIDHLSAPEVQGAVYPGAGSEGLLVLLGVVFWIGWHVISSKQEFSKLQKLARRRPSPNDWKSNVTDG
jgi:CO dehydrogenase/acetyl-CoA synthase epsilon subunit|tara:strand:- start:601 stop:819 length:219 start_codon:yes stop_codon:yes gene_type:complete